MMLRQSIRAMHIRSCHKISLHDGANTGLKFLLCHRCFAALWHRAPDTLSLCMTHTLIHVIVVQWCTRTVLRWTAITT
jgi:hypothetical protein